MTNVITAKMAMNNVVKDITITRGDLNKALFVNSQYTFGEGSTYKSKSIDTTLRIQRNNIRISVAIKTHQQSQNIKLNFVQSKPNILKLHTALINNEKIMSAKKLSEVLLCIYKHVRLSADPKWALDFTMKTEAREAAGQLLNTGMLPTFEIRNSSLIYVAPVISADKICKNSCKGCRLFN